MQTLLPTIPENELWITYARSSGPGGQNVNKRETKAVVRWHVDGSPLFSDVQKKLIHQRLANRISNDGYLLVDAEAERSQEQNRLKAIEVMQQLVRDAITPVAKRVATKPTRSSQRKRLDEKTLQGQRKKTRRTVSTQEE